MRKAFLMMMVLAASVMSASAEFLFWMVGNDNKDEYLKNTVNISDSSKGEYYAIVRYGVEDTPVTGWQIAPTSGNVSSEVGGDVIYNGNVYVNVSNWAYGDDGLGSESSIDLSGLGDLDDKSFYIEIFRYQNGYMNGVARSESVSYGDLGTYIGGTEGLPTEGQWAVWQGSGYSIPEPTSAMLLMIGLSLVGLKRKRA